MTNNLMELLKIKEQADKLIEKCELDTKAFAEKIADERTISLKQMQEGLSELQKVVFEFGLADNGGFIELNTGVDTEYLGGTEITVYFYSFQNYKGRIELGACKENGNRYGFPKRRNLMRLDRFPVSNNGWLSNHDIAMLTLAENWDSAYNNIEKDLIKKCNALLVKQMKNANDTNEKVKAYV